MELNTQTKRTILASVIASAKAERFQHECLGKAHHSIGNTEQADACAKNVAKAAQVIAELQKQLDDLPTE